MDNEKPSLSTPELFEEDKAAYLQTSAAAHIDDFVCVNAPAIRTGFDDLDKILDGGLYPGLYVIGAISSLGKTTLALQIADNLAHNGQDVLIFSLEMARHELIAKSISRTTFTFATDRRQAKTTRGVMAGERYADYTKGEMELISKAIGAYKEYAPHIFINEGVGDLGVDDIRETVKKHILYTGNRPVVLVDYIQILAPHDPRCSDKQNTDKAVLELKRISRDYEIPVFGISSFNRSSYQNGGGLNQGRVSMSDFKESGAIEYSADVLLGLEFASAGTSNYNEQEEKLKDPRDVRLVVLKNRNGRAWQNTDFKFYPMFNYFEEVKGTFEPAPDDLFSGIR